MASASGEKGRILLVSSSGGVLLDLLALEPWWRGHDTVWAAVRAADTESALEGNRTHWCSERKSSNPIGLVLGVFQAITLLRKEQIRCLVSAGTGIAVPFFVAARLLGVPTIWISTLNVIATPGLAARACTRLASAVLLQRETMRPAHPRGILIGELY